MMLYWVVLISMASITLAAPHEKLVKKQVERSTLPKYKHVGCYKDEGNRAIPTLEGTDIRLDGDYSTRSNPIQKCAEVARDLGYSMFAVQDGGWCASSANAENTFAIYGASSLCSNGEGGAWANDVYRLIDEGRKTIFVHLQIFATTVIFVTSHVILL
ncbi:uncharacterized protein LOC100371411 [Saccoglossus kowalevskii]|uniref:Uncharacterized protein LOC100371411 n=1 Tax=Saccoglossus kowalevskii TaxID=10224 RepID=A0ABM0GQC6_SACKO|nr:PREDICTED: uncharacterized protein LOC100371411 [Saccoglossus kowalevskii]